tara:strand:+ start:174 stop:515 length:342 start_codon:yes stop_codon:yes gene_type:complete
MLGTTLIVLAVIIMVVGALVLDHGTFSGIFDSRHKASEICKEHQGVLGQQAYSQCGQMVGSACRKGYVSSDRTRCEVPPNVLGYSIVVGSVLMLIAGIVVTILTHKKFKKKSH